MKLRSHIAPLACIIMALACLTTVGPASAQEFLPPGLIPPGMPYRAGGGFYIQAGVQFRNVEKFLMQKKNEPIRLVDTLGVVPFGPNFDTQFGSGTGVVGYPPTPTGNAAECPDVSGLWYYNNGFISPVGDTTTWPNSPFLGGGVLAGLGQYATTLDTPVNVGIFGVANPAGQVGGISGTPGFDPTSPPAFNATFSITWELVMNNNIPAADNGAACGYVPSRILVAQGIESNLSFAEQLWTPTFEVGYQWGPFFDVFFGFSWFSLKESFSKVFDTQADTYRRVFQDTFPFGSDNTANWVISSWTSNTVITTANVNNQILPDSPGLIGFPRRVFSERLDEAVPPLPVVEHASARTDLTAYEYKLGARSWTPLYGMGKFGFSIGPLMNLVNYRASAHEAATFFDNQGQPITTVSSAVKNTDWKTTFGFFFGTDLEIVSNVYFVRGTVLYSVQQQASVNADPVQTTFNLGGVSALLAGGLQF